jgi:hypothetical protein
MGSPSEMHDLTMLVRMLPDVHELTLSIQREITELQVMAQTTPSVVHEKH